jgi:hypothetical protein
MSTGQRVELAEPSKVGVAIPIFRSALGLGSSTATAPVSIPHTVRLPVCGSRNGSVASGSIGGDSVPSAVALLDLTSSRSRPGEGR